MSWGYLCGVFYQVFVQAQYRAPPVGAVLVGFFLWLVTFSILRFLSHGITAPSLNRVRTHHGLHFHNVMCAFLLLASTSFTCEYTLNLPKQSKTHTPRQKTTGSNAIVLRDTLVHMAVQCYLHSSGNRQASRRKMIQCRDYLGRFIMLK